ncbi:DUF1127 domain-containing protein [Ferrovibrio sp.]|uniref:DUF1127 domain-containing protein n=1 Tax=Ferrovibrio sp. TaxID=1917215 RepID=UPI00311FF368
MAINPQVTEFRYNPSLGLGRMAARAAIALFTGLLTWQRRVRERDQLASLSNAYLKDMGLSRADALREAGKPFWRD